MGFDKCIILYTYNYSVIQNNFTALKISMCFFYQSHPSDRQLWATTALFTVFRALLLPEYHRIGIIITFSDLVLSLNTMHFRPSLSFHASITNAFFFQFLNNIPSSECIHSLSLHLLKDMLVTSSFGWLWTKLLLSICRQVVNGSMSFQIRQIPRNVIVRSEGKAVFSSSVKKLQIRGAWVAQLEKRASLYLRVHEFEPYHWVKR